MGPITTGHIQVIQPWPTYKNMYNVHGYDVTPNAILIAGELDRY